MKVLGWLWRSFGCGVWLGLLSSLGFKGLGLGVSDSGVGLGWVRKLGVEGLCSGFGS